MSKKLQAMKILIIVFSVLLAISLSALACVLLFGRSELSTGSDSVTDNYIKPTKSESASVGAAKLCASPVSLLSASQKTTVDADSTKNAFIRIYKRHAEDSTPFRVFNMFPGDSYTRSFFVEISHKGTVTVRFYADIRQGSEKLAEVLKCKVVLRGENEPLYDGLMRDMPISLNYKVSSVFGTTTELVYDITVYLDTSVGNEYMEKALMADFRWWVYDSGGGSNPPDTDPLDSDTTGPDDPSDTRDPSDTTSDPGDDDGELISPETGVNVHFCIWFWVAMISIFINLILLRPGRSRKDEKEGEKNEK